MPAPADAAPTTREGIEKYLSGTMVKGIGPIDAKKLVGKFGEEIFNVIETQSARPEKVDCIGPMAGGKPRLPGEIKRSSAKSWYSCTVTASAPATAV